MLFQFSNASSSYYQGKFNESKRLYLGAVMSGNSQNEIKYLKKIINYGEKLKIDTLKYKKELNKLDKSSIVTNSLSTTFKLKPKFTINSVTAKDDMIILEFDKNIKLNKSYLNFFEKKYKDYSRDYFDIKGNFEHAKKIKINLRGVDRTTIYQHSKNILRIYLQNKTNPKTIYFMNNNKLVIKHLYTAPKKQKKQQKVKVIKKELKKKDLKDVLFKTKYSIDSVEQTSDTITVNFNKNVNKSYIKFFERKYSRFSRDYFDIKGNFKGAQEKKIVLDGVDRTVIYQYKKDILRIYLQKRKNPKTIYIIGNKKIIIKYLGEKSKKTIEQKDIFYPSGKIVVLDAGHGGKDPGAVNPRKVYEKNIVFNITRYVKAELLKKGFKVYLTRNRDKFIRLSSRTKYANRKKADIFVSIHANAVPKRNAKKARGIETYFLSPARSERAKRVAALENKGDISNMGWSSKNSLLTILNQSKITASNKMAIDIQKNMLYRLRNKYGKNAIKDGGVREGPFWVLVGAQMPAVLVEVGYISHPIEGRRVATTSYQKTIAKGIAEGISSYFVKNSF